MSTETIQSMKDEFNIKVKQQFQQATFEVKMVRNEFDQREMYLLQNYDQVKMKLPVWADEIGKIKEKTKNFENDDEDDFEFKGGKEDFLNEIQQWEKNINCISEVLPLMEEVTGKWNEIYATLTRSKKMTNKILTDERDQFNSIRSYFSCRSDGRLERQFRSYDSTEGYLTNFKTAMTKADKVLDMLEAKKKRIDKIFENIDKKQEKIDEEDIESRTITIDITDDMYCGSLDPEMVQDFTCMLCYGIVMDPIKCTRCNNLLCKKCVNGYKLERNELECYKKCGNRKHSKLSQIEQAVYDSLVFRCQNDDCTCRIPLSKYQKHLRKDCPVQTYKHVKTMQGTCNQYDSNGRAISGAVIDDGDLFESDDDEFGSPYDYVLQNGELEKLFKETA